MIVIETERLMLRRLSTDDAGFIFELLNEPSFLRYIGDRGVKNIEDARRYILVGPVASYERNGFGLYMVELKESRVPVGMCGLIKREGLPAPDIGFAFLPAHWSKGYAVESASSVVAYARDALGLKRILAITTQDNDSSINVLRKIGLRFERLIRLSEDEPELNLFALDF